MKTKLWTTFNKLDNYCTGRTHQFGFNDNNKTQHKKKNKIYGYQDKGKFISIYHTKTVILKAIFKAIEPYQKCSELMLNENKNNK